MTVHTLTLPRQAISARLIPAVVLGFALVLAQTLGAQARGAPESFADLADKISPSVVNITTATTVATASDPHGEGGPIVPEGSPFEDFFRDFMERNGPDGAPQRPRRSSALGSGFVISEDGFIVTNNHVIAEADEITIEFFSGDELPAEVIGTDPKTDLALLKVETDTPLPFVPWGNSDKARVGDWVMAMGNPLGQGFSVSAGIVSARGRALSGSYDDFIQTDAAINRGNSGGPLFNMDGEVIGINTAILSPNGGSIGIGFAMSSRVATNVIDQLKEFGETRRGWLGVRIQDVTDDVADAIGLEEAKGALVTDVPEGPAMEAGVLAGDVILSFDGTDVDDTRELVQQVGNAEVGKSVRLTVYRDGKTETVMVTLGRRETAEGAVPAVATPEDIEEPQESEVLGLTLSPLTPTIISEMDLDEGMTGLLVKEVDESTEAFEKGMRAGDIITQVGQVDVASIEDLEARIEEVTEAGRMSILLLVRRAGEPRFVALTLDN
ncbi:DegQ family serine endoprotease [Tropicimonas sp. TH_r6]|uniref:DegQ family serine endoprotease n=1 Tax=Tropicimonas sp. TH_r6 TaxID=3082085 RepID=UPI002953FFE4|nr:DegQ family serine endoprotease [Tropicimonas sp. TH_r6]MDV7144553.1 DegQ family serine endoprotease [Tropicimonas sp. TH_r6]